MRWRMRVTTIGRFTVERLLSNHGATAQVYLAHDSERQVALKIVRGNLYQDHLRQEVETLRRFDHPGVVRLYPALGDDLYTARAETLSGQPWYFAMEYLQPLSVKQFPLAWRLEMFRRLVESVAYLHSQGYAHGDLKPEHILLRYTPDSGQIPQPVLIDFGSACSISEPPPEPTASIPYAAPELLRVIFDGESPASLQPAALDTWALGAILYEWATGQRLVAGLTRRAVVRNTINGRFDLEKAPAFLPRILAMMLEVRPEARATLQDIQKIVNLKQLSMERSEAIKQEMMKSKPDFSVVRAIVTDYNAKIDALYPLPPDYFKYKPRKDRWLTRVIRFLRQLTRR